MTKTKRSKASSLVTVSILHCCCVLGCPATQRSRFWAFRCDAGVTIAIAFSINLRLTQDRAHSLNTDCSLSTSSTVETKHCSDSLGLVVSNNASRYKVLVSFLNVSHQLDS